MPIDFYIKLTLAVYRVSELFPEQATLKRDIRNLANEILVGLIMINNDNDFENTSRNIDEIKGLFELAEAKNWVDSRNFSVLKREYEKVAELSYRESGALRSHESSFAKASEGSPSPSDLLGRNEVLWRRRGKTVPASPAGGEKPRITQNRKEEILEILKARKTIQVKELIQDFPKVSKRTLIRDLKELYRAGAVLRIGNGRASCYNIKL